MGLLYLLIFPGVPIAFAVRWARRQARYLRLLTEFGARYEPGYLDGPLRTQLGFTTWGFRRNARAAAGELGPDAKRLYEEQLRAWQLTGIVIFAAGLSAFLLSFILK